MLTFAQWSTFWRQTLNLASFPWPEDLNFELFPLALLSSGLNLNFIVLTFHVDFVDGLTERKIDS